MIMLRDCLCTIPFLFKARLKQTGYEIGATPPK